MKIKELHKIKEFGNVPDGDIFRLGNDIYLKKESSNFVTNCKNGSSIRVGNATVVIHLPNAVIYLNE